LINQRPFQTEAESFTENCCRVSQSTVEWFLSPSLNLSSSLLKDYSVFSFSGVNLTVNLGFIYVFVHLKPFKYIIGYKFVLLLLC